MPKVENSGRFLFGEFRPERIGKWFCGVLHAGGVERGPPPPPPPDGFTGVKELFLEPNRPEFRPSVTEPVGKLLIG